MKHVPIKFDYETEIEQINSPNGRLYQTPKGNKYPSITTVLSAQDKIGLEEWRKRVGKEEANRVSHHAAYRGTVIHELMEKYVRGDEINKSKLMPHHKASLNNLTPILDENLDEWYVQEKRMWSDFLGVAGTMDLGGRFNKKRSVIDFKTSAKMKKHKWISNYFIQGCAYSIMFEERTGIPLPQLVIIMDIDNNNPKVFVEKRDDWVKQLLKAIEDYKQWKNL
jgi:hypothetical protein